MATNHLKRAHYSNAVMLTPSGEPMTTIGDDKVSWYLDRGLADLVDYPGYSRAIKLRFQPKGVCGEANDLVRMANQCVVCGKTETLSLHHVSPYSVKRHYPLKDKANTRHLCVLLCEEHHKAIEVVNQRLTESPYDRLEPHFRFVNRCVGLYFRWLKRVRVRYWLWRKGGPKAINSRYIALFLTEMKPKHLPPDWLQP